MNKVKERREELSMTQQELAIKSNISRYLISQIENNDDINLTKKTMTMIADALNCKVTDIFLF